jgi:tetratricopeptide (TPR) repeat protein
VYQQNTYVAPGYTQDTYAGVVEPAPPQEAAPVEPDPEAAEIHVPTEREQELLKNGMTSFESGDYEKAARLFLQAAMANPDNIDALLAYAVARFATGDYAVSAIAIRRGVSKFPGVVNAAFDVRDRYGRPDDFEPQMVQLERFVQVHPDDIDAWLVLGFIRHFSDQRELSARTFQLLLKTADESDAMIAEIFLTADPLPDPAEQQEPEDGDGRAAPQTVPSAGGLVEEAVIPVIADSPFDPASDNEFPLP